jgi:hypothetical protein
MNASEQTNDVWEMYKTPLTVDYGDGIPEVSNFSTITRKSDGFTMIWRKRSREGMSVFICKMEDKEFSFYAQRWDYDKESLSDTYIVEVTLHHREWSLNQTENSELILKYAKSVEKGLLHFSTTGQDTDFPVKEVWFDLASYPKHNFVKAEDL